MKKIIVVTMLVAPLTIGMSSSFAARDNVGCGLGSTLFDGQSGVFPQVLAVTTNGTSGNQTFGISSGTLGCEEGGVVQASAAVSMFAGNNLDTLSRDMSIGQGESIESLAVLMGVGEEDKTTFLNTVRSNYSKIFTSHNITAGKMLDNLYQVLSNEERLSKYVSA